MVLRIHDTLSREKPAFEPYDPKNVRMYVCGPTVYDSAHIGNARPIVVFDVLYRLLRHTYGADHVKYVRNITDVDDKIMAAAKANKEDIESLTKRTEDAFHADMAALGALEPDVEPRATEHIPEMLDLVASLIESGHAYEAEGHVLFDIASMPEYGRLSGHSREELIAGARVEVAPYKKDPADFVLWKPSEADQPGWESPWGRGRPGWHLECSAMSEKHLGVPFDIHGGGQDLIFPHHENEIAQSRCAHQGGPFAKYWMHNGYLVVEGEKMSKSLGNFYTVRDLLDGYPNQQVGGEIVRFSLLTVHYRQPLDWTESRVRSARTRLNRYHNVLWQLRDEKVVDEVDPPSSFLEALEDDLNTPRAISILDDMVRHFHKLVSPTEKSELKSELLACGRLLGIFRTSAGEWRKQRRETQLFKPQVDGSVSEGIGLGLIVKSEVEDEEERIDRLIEQRTAARAAKDFAEADRLREELRKNRVILEDNPDGTTDWRRE